MEIYVKVYFLVVFILTDAHRKEDEEGKNFSWFFVIVWLMGLIYELFLRPPANIPIFLF